MSINIDRLIHSACHLMMKTAQRTKSLSLSDIEYVNKHISHYAAGYSSMTSAEELKLTIVLDGKSLDFRIIDFICLCALATTNKNIAITLIDAIKNSNEYDSIVTNSKFVKFILEMRTVVGLYTNISHNSVSYLDCIVGHIFEKFRDLYKMNFNFRKFKGVRKQRITPMMSKIYVTAFENDAIE